VGPGIKGVAKGLWHAHVGWLFKEELTSAERWAPDLWKDPVMRKIDKYFPVWVVLSFTLPGIIGGVVTGSFGGAVSAFVWASLARIFFLHHVTWSINSICHFYGNRPFKTSDHSTNNWLLALISFGESWHNNHHAFPTSAVHGIGRGQVDLSGGTIRLLQKMRLVRDVKVVSPKQLAAKRIQ
jgi:stearoyl-CoA desaturase (delta-9 desaturase)